MSDTMRALTCRSYGPPTRMTVEHLPRPKPGPGEVHLRVEAAGLNAGDWHLCQGSPALVRLMFGLTKPKFPVLGSEVAGVVEGCGDDAPFSVGQRVAAVLDGCGFGGFAEQVVAPATAVTALPDDLDAQVAATLPTAGITALQAVRDVLAVSPGERVVIFGASGGVGSFAVSIAKFLAARVTAVCSRSKLDHVRSLGPDQAYAYEELPADEHDAVLVVHARRSVRSYLPFARHGGRMLLVGGAGYEFLRAAALILPARLGGRRLLPPWVATPTPEDLAEVVRLAADGVLRPRLDDVVPLEGVGEALARMERGEATGKIVAVTV